MASVAFVVLSVALVVASVAFVVLSVALVVASVAFVVLSVAFSVVDGSTSTPVSYTHLDVYKRQCIT